MKNNKNSVLLNSVSANLIGILGTILGIVLFAASIFLYTNSIEEADRETLRAVSERCIKWMDENQEASKEEYEDKRKEVQEDILQKLHL